LLQLESDHYHCGDAYRSTGEIENTEIPKSEPAEEMTNEPRGAINSVRSA
jgi:hypothetical protein